MSEKEGGKNGKIDWRTIKSRARGIFKEEQATARSSQIPLADKQDILNNTESSLTQFLQREDVKSASATIQSLFFALLNATESRPNVPLQILSLNDAQAGVIRLLITADATNDATRATIMKNHVLKTVSSFAKYHQAETENVMLKSESDSDESDGFLISADELAALNGTFPVNTIEPRQLILGGLSINYFSEKIVRSKNGDPKVHILLGLDDPFSFHYKTAYQTGELTQLTNISIKSMGIYIGSMEGDSGADF